LYEDCTTALWNERKAKMVQYVSVYSGRNTALTTLSQQQLETKRRVWQLKTMLK